MSAETAGGSGSSSNGHGNSAVYNGEGSNLLPTTKGASGNAGNSGSSANGHTNGHAHGTSQEDQLRFRPLYEGSRLDRTEFVRITLQSLKELGYE